VEYYLIIVAQCYSCFRNLLKLSYIYIQVGVLDVDLCGPSVPRMLRIEDHSVIQGDDGLVICTHSYGYERFTFS
jgi:Mrp family chromosome partitioning ATPase